MGNSKEMDKNIKEEEEYILGLEEEEEYMFGREAEDPFGKALDNPINMAIRHGTIDDVQNALDNPDNFKYINDPVYSPLMLAVTSEKLDFIPLLVENEFVDLALYNFTGLTPFHAACVIGNMEVLKLFIDSLEDPLIPQLLDLRNIHGETPLHTAVNAPNSTDVVQFLIHHGASALAKDNRDTYPSFVCHGNAQVKEILEIKERQELALLHKEASQPDNKQLDKTSTQEEIYVGSSGAGQLGRNNSIHGSGNSSGSGTERSRMSLDAALKDCIDDVGVLTSNKLDKVDKMDKDQDLLIGELKRLRASIPDLERYIKGSSLLGKDAEARHLWLHLYDDVKKVAWFTYF